MNVCYVYKKTEPQLWTVGYYTPFGVWETDSDWSSPEQAAQRVAWLNGSTPEVKQESVEPGDVIEVTVLSENGKRSYAVVCSDRETAHGYSLTPFDLASDWIRYKIVLKAKELEGRPQ